MPKFFYKSTPEGIEYSLSLESSVKASYSRDYVQYRFGGFNVSCPWREVAVSTVSFSLLSPVPSFSVGLSEYSLLYVSLHSA